MRAILLFILAVTSPEPLSAATGTSLVVFVRDNEIYRANEDGSQLRQLTNDGKAKHEPKWSPDGGQIAYLTAGDMTRDPKSRAKIEIIDKDGKYVGTAPVLATMADGSEVGGMRWIDSIGWYDSQRIFVRGSASPYSAEYRTIDIRSGQMGGYVVSQSTTCSTKGLVAYWVPVFPPSKAMRLEINGTEVAFEFPDVNRLASISVPLVWTPDCEYLAFLDPRPPGALVLVHSNKVERKVDLPEEGSFHLDGSTPAGTGLLLAGSKKTLVYDIRRNTLSEALPATVQQVKLQRAAREHVVRKLKGESPDWWTAPTPSAPAVPGRRAGPNS
jgi:hypothetical protein